MNEKTTTAKGAVLDAPAQERSTIRFPEALPGLDGAHDWQLAELEDARPFLYLKSLDRPELQLLVVDPRRVVAGYAPKLGAAALGRIRAESADACLMLSAVTIDGPGSATMNLRAPLVINPDAMIGAQVILEDSRWPLRHRLGAAGRTREGQGGPDDAGPEPQVR